MELSLLSSFFEEALDEELFAAALEEDFGALDPDVLAAELLDLELTALDDEADERAELEELSAVLAGLALAELEAFPAELAGLELAELEELAAELLGFELTALDDEEGALAELEADALAEFEELPAGLLDLELDAPEEFSAEPLDFELAALEELLGSELAELGFELDALAETAAAELRTEELDELAERLAASLDALEELEELLAADWEESLAFDVLALDEPSLFSCDATLFRAAASSAFFPLSDFSFCSMAFSVPYITTQCSGWYHSLPT